MGTNIWKWAPRLSEGSTFLNWRHDKYCTTSYFYMYYFRKKNTHGYDTDCCSIYWWCLFIWIFRKPMILVLYLMTSCKRLYMCKSHIFLYSGQNVIELEHFYTSFFFVINMWFLYPWFYVIYIVKYIMHVFFRFYVIKILLLNYLNFSFVSNYGEILIN